MISTSRQICFLYMELPIAVGKFGWSEWINILLLWLTTCLSGSGEIHEELSFFFIVRKNLIFECKHIPLKFIDVDKEILIQVIIDSTIGIVKKSWYTYKTSNWIIFCCVSYREDKISKKKIIIRKTVFPFMIYMFNYG